MRERTEKVSTARKDLRVPEKPTSTEVPPEEYGEECGGKGGVRYSVFTYAPSRIKKVTIWHRQYVDGIQLETEQGALPIIGSTGQHRDIRKESFELGVNEYLVGITVEYWGYIDRVTFHTNKHSYGPYGGHGGRMTRKLSAPPGRMVVGFKGKHWKLVDSIQLMVSSAPVEE